MAYRGVPKNPAWLDPDRDLSTASRTTKIAYDYWQRIQTQTPPWHHTEVDKVSALYKRAEALGMHVDHIVPLRSPIVCGLNCYANLQLLPPEVNLSKSNHMWPGHPCEPQELPLDLPLPDWLVNPQLRLPL